MGFWNQLVLLLWKNFTLRKRQKLRLVAEIIFPLALFLILLIVRVTKPDLKVRHPQCHFDGKAMPSAGILPFVQSFVCTFNNTCHEQVNPDEMAGVTGSFNDADITQLIQSIEEVLNNNVDVELITDILHDINVLSVLYPKLLNGSTQGTISLGNSVIDPQQLRTQILNGNFNITSDVVDWLLDITLNQKPLTGDLSTSSTILFVESLIPSLFISWNNSLTVIREEICDKKRLDEIFVFPNETVKNDVHDELCNLSIAQFTTLANDIRDGVNLTILQQDLMKFVEDNTGTPLRLSSVDFLSNLSQSNSWQKPLQDLIATFQRLQQDFPSTVASGAQALTQTDVLGQFVCGRQGTFLAIDEDQEEALESDNNNRQTMAPNTNPNPTTTQATTPAGKTGVTQPSTTPDPNDIKNNARLKDRNCTRNISSECSALFSTLSGSSSTRFLWRQLKPFVRGCIVYYPQNNVTDTIIANAQQFFIDLENIGQLATDWGDYSPVVRDILNNSDAVNTLREIVRSETVCNYVESLVFNQLNQPYSGDYCGFLRQYLDNGPNTTQYNWRDSVSSLDMAFGLISNYSQCFNFDKFVGYNNREEMVEDSLLMIDKDLYWAAVEFEGVEGATSLPTHISYKIRMDTDKVDSTKRVQDKYYRPGPRRRPAQDTKYFTFGFAYIQDMVEHAIIKLQTGVGGVNAGIGIMTQQFPYPCYTEDKFIYAISRMLPLFMILAWILTTAMLCKSIVYEKDARLKEVMKIMGLGNGVHWMAWFINAFVMMFATVLILVILLKVGKVLEHSDASAVLFFITIFSIATIVKCFLISVFFSRPNLAACCAGFIYFVLYLPYMLMLQFDDVLTRSTKMAVGLLSNVAFGYGCNFIALWEEQAIGLQWSNMGESPITDDDFNMLHCILMMIIDTILYAMLTWYIEAVFPGQYGIPKPLYFPFTKSYWCGTGSLYEDNSMLGRGTMELNGQNPETMEAEPKDKKVGVAIRNLKKKYSSTNKLAVDGLSINFYEDQITSFLGHNGAGKTTTMSILTGLFPPSEGTAYIHGEDIRTKMDNIRHSLGMCPQHNVLFDQLTVEEHLWFYARLKGASSRQVKDEMKQMIKDVGLPHKRHELSSNLSGGMKRKLSVAIAFVGDSKTVILDEPTAGVDPYARRAIWQLLLKLKKGRTIILSTHHMDEADVLGDRIAIISLGKLCCVGSSLFLKNRYGNGYYLTLVRSDGDVDEDEMLKSQFMMDNGRPMSAGSVRTITSVLPTVENDDEGYADGKSDSDPPTPPSEDNQYNGLSVKKVTAFIKKFVTSARLVEDNMTELCYQLPDEAAARGDFEELFFELERSHVSLGISSFGISDTSLEEVFLKVAEENAVDEPSDETKRTKFDEMADGGRMPRAVNRLSFRRKKKLSLFGRRGGRVDSKTDLMADDDTESVMSEAVSEYGNSAFSHRSQGQVTGWSLTLRQFMAIFGKRFHHVRRSKKGLLVEIVLPVLFIMLAMIFTLLAPPLSDEPALELHPWHYVPKRGDPHLYMFYNNDAEGSTLATKFESMIQTKPGIGNRCVNKYSIDGYGCEPVTKQTFAKSVYTNTTVDCDCSTGWQVCPDNAGGHPPPQVTLATTDYLQNMTDRNISDWLIKTWKPYQKKRYGGLSFGEIDQTAILTNTTQLQSTLERLLAAANNGTSISLGNTGNITSQFWNDFVQVLPTLAVRDNAKVWYNNKGWASSVSYINVMNNVILRSNLPPGVNPADYGITAINHPMKMTKKQLNDEALYSSFKDVVIAICIIFAMSFIPASFTMYLIEERTSNSKHLQFVSGVNPLVYWISNFCWDMINYIIPSVLCIFIFLAFNKAAYVSPTNGPCLVVLLFLYGWAMIPLMYPFSRFFNVPSTALVVLKSVNIFLGTTATMATFIIEFLEEDDPDLKSINTILKQVFLVLPQYCLGRGLFDMAKNQLFADVYERLGEGNRLPNPFDWDQIGRNMFSLFMLGILFFIINLLIEYNFFIRSRVLKSRGESLHDEDDDVARERKRVLSGGADDDVMRLMDLTKEFSARGKKGRLTAVDRLTIGVPKGQCFGLLGVNGAGKTTTFKMLTGDERLTRGNAYVNNYSILNNMVQVRQNIGYCPQFDALDPLLTGVEHLRFYARLRGIPEDEVKDIADWGIRRLGLIQHADKISSNYSGGNKRKLSTAISLIGNPSIIFLDEPTTGMDPGARRFLWDCISNIVKDGRSVILTSHSMEECEALCGRLAIMVNGRFRCLGSIQHLKNKFGDGYTVIVRVSGERPDMEPVVDFFTSEFPQSVLKERHHNMLQYQLGSDVKLSALFGSIEAVRAKLHIEDYSVSQTTLDQVFINFAKLQTDLGDDDVDDCPEDLKYLVDSHTGLPSEYDGRSLAGSTAGLIPHEQVQALGAYNPGLLQMEHMVTRPVVTLDSGNDAPIISLPVQDEAEASKGGDFDIESQASSLPRKHGRPISKFDTEDDFSTSIIPNPEV